MKQYIGVDKPVVELTVEKKDRWYYDRWKAAQKLNMKVWDMADEPDIDIYNLKEKE